MCVCIHDEYDATKTRNTSGRKKKLKIFDFDMRRNGPRGDKLRPLTRRSGPSVHPSVQLPGWFVFTARRLSSYDDDDKRSQKLEKTDFHSLSLSLSVFDCSHL